MYTTIIFDGEFDIVRVGYDFPTQESHYGVDVDNTIQV